MRPFFIAGNWKMNPDSQAAAIALAEQVKAGVGQEGAVRVALCPPFVHLPVIDKLLENTPIGLGAQNMHWAPRGAYTGEVSGAMLHDAGCTHVILGHSERRHGLGETDALVHQKLTAALAVGLIPIVCIGETLAEREAGRTLEVVSAQLDGSLGATPSEQVAGLVLAYEPVWAIGTGKVATPEQAQEVHALIRQRLALRHGTAIADRVTIQYGGSVKPDNAPQLLACPDVDGALVGGASLNAGDFLGIIAAARALARTRSSLGPAGSGG
jgi:triosephosphate isomerase